MKTYKGHAIRLYVYAENTILAGKHFATVDEKMFPDAEIPFVSVAHDTSIGAVEEAERWIDGQVQEEE
jgi:hypothetical protein